MERSGDGSDLASQITELAGHLNAGNHRFLTLIAEFDHRKGWTDGATQSCAHWLNWKCGLAMGAAREKVRVAHALSTLPKISLAMSLGELSYSKVRELTRVACHNTEDENEDGEPLNVGRKTRTISAPLRRFLNARDKGCRFPGCTNTKFVDGHHIKHWAEGGETKASNLVSLCRFHHRKVHEGAVQVLVLDDGAFRFVQSNDQVFDSILKDQVTDWTILPAQHVDRGITIDARTAATRWRGEPCDYGLGVQVLLQHAKRVRNVSAGTSGR